MTDILSSLWGADAHLDALQMSVRGVVVFALTLFMFRISGRRSLSQHSPFDACITVLLGAILSRCVVGASPFLPTIASGAVLVLLHRAVAMLSVRFQNFDVLVNGSPRTLLLNGNSDPLAMRKGLVSRADLLQAVREHGTLDELSAIRRIDLERDGTLTVIRDQSGAHDWPAQ